MSTEGFRWYCFRTLVVYEVLDEAIEEFIDDDFIPDWKGIERSTYLVWAQSEEQARGELIESTEGVKPSVNVYGQRIRDRVLRMDARGLVDLEPPGRFESKVLEAYWEFWNARSETDPVAFLEAERPLPVRASSMLRPLTAGASARRVHELRGALLAEDGPRDAQEARAVRVPPRELELLGTQESASEADAGETNTWRWYGVQLRSFLETLDPPIDELVDAAQRHDWMGIEVGYFLVSARDFEEVDRVVAEREDGCVLVNSYGQRVERGVLETTWIEISDRSLHPAAVEFVITLCREVWDTNSDQDARDFLKSTQPEPISRPLMINPIAFYEHKARYEELTGRSTD